MGTDGPLQVIRFVAMRSATGRYGGPSDTAFGQASIAQLSGLSVRLAYGYLRGDAPQKLSDRDIAEPCRLLSTRVGFASLLGMRLISRLAVVSRTPAVFHVSLSRELLPIVVSALALIRRRPVVVQPHGMLTATSGRKQRMVDVVTRPLYRRASAVIALTEDEKRKLLQWEKKSPTIWVVGNPAPRSSNHFSTDHPLLSGTQRYDAMYIGRIEPRKRVNDFIEAATISRGLRDGITYAVVGPVERSHEHLIANVDPQVCTTYRPVPPEDLYRVLQRTSIFVLPSLAEPWGNVLLAALKEGLPVVVTRSTALAVTIERAEAGIIVPDADPHAIRDAVKALSDNQELRETMGVNARQLYSAKFSDSVVSESLLRIYESVWPG